MAPWHRGTVAKTGNKFGENWIPRHDTPRYTTMVCIRHDAIIYSMDRLNLYPNLALQSAESWLPAETWSIFRFLFRFLMLLIRMQRPTNYYFSVGRSIVLLFDRKNGGINSEVQPYRASCIYCIWANESSPYSRRARWEWSTANSPKENGLLLNTSENSKTPSETNLSLWLLFRLYFTLYSYIDMQNPNRESLIHPMINDKYIPSLTTIKE